MGWCWSFGFEVGSLMASTLSTRLGMDLAPGRDQCCAAALLTLARTQLASNGSEAVPSN